MSDLIGQTLGPYRIVEQLGSGGMATVYKAYQPAMDRYVAIKVLPQHLARDPNFHARFQREARIIARLEHRYILPVYDVGESGGINYMVMRYTDAGILSDLIASGTLTIPRTVQLVAQVAEALDFAHRQQIIHRDIKPANVLISREGDVLLSDFGIARIIEATLHLTSDGMLIGTPYYMAPEQVQGQPADARTDLYALGVVLYEALTGQRPFEAETPLAVALMHVHNPLPLPRQRRPDLPEALERIILRAMAKNPADRFQTAAEMATALRLAPLDAVPPSATAETLASPVQSPAANTPPRSVNLHPTSTSRVTIPLSEKSSELSPPGPRDLTIRDARNDEGADSQDVPRAIQTKATALPLAQARPVQSRLGKPIALAVALLGVALNISLGHIVQTTPALPLYLDTVGTIFVGALLGPWAGLVIGLLSHVLWSLIGLSSGTEAIWFSYVTAVAGLIAGLAGRAGLFARRAPGWLAAILGAVGLWALTYCTLTLLGAPYDQSGAFPWTSDLLAQQPLLFAAAGAAGAVLGYVWLQRVGYIGLIGLLTGVFTAVLAEPMVKYRFSGFSGSGLDMIVHAISTAGENISAPILGNGRISDPFDKMISFLIVWLMLQIVPRRLLVKAPDIERDTRAEQLTTEPNTSQQAER